MINDDHNNNYVNRQNRYSNVLAKNVNEMKQNTRIKLNENSLIYRIFKRNALFCVRPVAFSFFV